MKIKLQVIAALGLVFFLSIPLPAFAQEPGGGIDQFVNNFFGKVFGPFVSFIFYSVTVNGVSFPLIVAWLIFASIFLTVYMGFIQFTGVKHSIDLLRGVYSNPEDAGEVSHFQALATALSGTVGLGNIAGVAVAVSLGGPGATFWMIAAGLCGMAAKFTECSLGVKYREEFPDGRVSGGPMYYLSKGLAEKGKAGFGKVIAALFAIMCIFGCLGGGNMFQGNQAHQMIANTFGIFTESGWLFGLILAVIVGAVIIGGIKSIAKVTEKIVPLMAILYVGTALIILLANFGKIPWAFGLVITGAFSPEAIGGGIIGVMIQGLKRAAFSNEAGVGSAAIAHSAVKTNEPLTEGYVALLEPPLESPMVDFQNILFPVSLTDISPVVAPYVATVAKRFDAKLHLLHVLRRFDWFVDTYVSQPSETDFKSIASDFENQLLSRAQQTLEAFKDKHFKGLDIVKSTVVSGTHYKKILDYVESEKIDLIIMGTGSPLQKAVFGSVADKVAKLSSVPVMLVKSN
jgi:AGCS family alanine or glycine:cation symporter